MAGKAWKVHKQSPTKKVLVRKDRSVEESNMIRDLKTQANEKNGARSEEERKKIFWRVMNMDLRKWYRGE